MTVHISVYGEYKFKFNSYSDKSGFICRHKLNKVVEMIKGNNDLLMIAKTKLDDSFPCGHFHIGGSGLSIKLDRNK